MLWVGAKHALRIDCPRIPNEHYPDNDSSVELYTNGGPLPYVELETLSPLRTLAVGQSLSATNTYTIYHRKHSNPELEASEIYRNAR